MANNPFDSPDYDKIIREELAKIRDYSLVENEKVRLKLERNNPIYKNPAHNNAEVEAFEAAVNSRLLNEKEIYFSKLDEYKRKLEERRDEIDKLLKEKEKEVVEKKEEFNLAKKFYDNFQNLINSKFSFIHNEVKEILRSQNSKSESEKEK